jgi:O-antigen ligase
MATATAALPRTSPVLKAGYAVTLIYLYITYSRLIEVVVPALRITALVYAAALGLAVISGGFRRALSHRIGRFIAGYVIWLVLATPFSMWKGGSVSALIEVSKNIPVYFLVAGMAIEIEDAKKAIHTLGYAVLTLAILTFFYGDLLDGRLRLSSGKFANPNDLAQALLLSLPLWWLMATKSDANPLRRLAAFPALAAIAFVMSKTGSRGALIAAAATGLVFFLHVSLANKLKLAAAGMAMLALAAAFLPADLRARYVTLFEAEQAASEARTREGRQEAGPSMENALGSTEGRLGLLVSSLQLTAAHPLFGVGPAMFQVAEKDLAEEEGRRGNWHETHNAYTQVSSEAGVPALVFFLGALALSLKSSNRVYRKYRCDPRMQPVAHAALAVELSLVAYAVSAFFASVAYGNLMPTLAGLAVALESAAAAAGTRAKTAEQATEKAAPRRPRPGLGLRARTRR